jgi:hypothetical protein
MTRALTRLKELNRHPRMLVALPAAAVAVTLAACGSSGGPPAHPAAPKPAGAAHSHAHSAPPHAAAAAPPKHARAAHHHAHPAPPPAAATSPPAPPATPPAPIANPIPQGNGGDQDADNNGGPSDGDGNI